MFLVFGGESYYPAGGAYDVLFKTLDYDDAVRFCESVIGKYGFLDGQDPRDCCGIEIEWAHVIDGNLGDIIFSSGGMPYGGGGQIFSISETMTEKG
jgi:hypothetical protein